MAIPDFQTLMLPLLTLTGDGKVHTVHEVSDALAEQLGLSEADRKEAIASGGSRFDNRIAWARTYLKEAGLLESTGRGSFRITDRGRALLRQRPSRIDVKFLKQFPEFLEFKNRRRSDRSMGKCETDEETERTPEEVLEASYQQLRQELAHELLQAVKKCSPRFFEELVVDLLVAMGYGGNRVDAGQAIGRSGDDGVDGFIKEDRLGLDVIYIQAKRWDTPVGRPVVQAFAGSLEGQRAKKGVLITTSQFSKDALEYASKIEKRIVLIDGEQLAQLMIDHDVGVTPVASYVVKRIDLDYFGDELAVETTKP